MAKSKDEKTLALEKAIKRALTYPEDGIVGVIEQLTSGPFRAWQMGILRSLEDWPVYCLSGRNEWSNHKILETAETQSALELTATKFMRAVASTLSEGKAVIYFSGKGGGRGGKIPTILKAKGFTEESIEDLAMCVVVKEDALSILCARTAFNPETLEKVNYLSAAFIIRWNHVDGFSIETTWGADYVDKALTLVHCTLRHCRQITEGFFPNFHQVRPCPNPERAKIGAKKWKQEHRNQILEGQ